jgi:hypothetical protein
MKKTKGQINNFNINMFTAKTVQIPINQINNSKALLESDLRKRNCEHYEKYNNSGEINNELYFNENFEISKLKRDISLNNCDKNNDFIYPILRGITLNEKNKNYDKNTYMKKILDIKTNDETNRKFQIINKENSENNSNNNSNKSHVLKKFINLDNSKNISFAIYSIYENINKLSNYKFQKNSLLRQKTKTFILNNCLPKQKSIESSKMLKNKFIGAKNNSPISRIKFHSSINKNDSVINKNRREEEDLIKNKNPKRKRKLSIDNENNIYPIKRIKTNDINKYKKRKFSNLFKNKVNKNIFNNSIISHDEMHSNKNRLKRATLNINTVSEFGDDKEKNFYSRVKTFRKVQKIKEREKDKEASTIGKKLNLQERISQNIEKNKQNLNNPEEYFSGFFKNILIKKKTQKNLRAFNNQKKTMNKNKKDTHIKSPAKSKNTEFDFERITHLRRNSTLNEDNSRSFRI